MKLNKGLSKKLLFTLCCILSIFTFNSFTGSDKFESTFENSPIIGNKPKLVVGIVVDQMRYDYLTRFYSRYGQGGFKRLLDNGFNCKNNHFNYIPTYTGPGHSSVYTGTTPKYHGIISNSWYDKEAKTVVYCASDDSVATVGSITNAGKMSPHRMKTNSFADENRLSTQMRGKTIGIALKDRGSILPAGHSANAAYWFDGGNEGKWITSTYYMETLPRWVSKFNNENRVAPYLTTWNTLYPIKTYTASGADENSYERGFNGKETATFPYDLNALKGKNGNFEIVRATPFGNSLTTDFAIAALKGEELGKDDITDILAVSYSSTDYIGHNFGVNSVEIEDTYLRLDKDLERLFKALDDEVGVGNYTIFLTSDHGAVDVPAYLFNSKIPAGYVNMLEIRDSLSLYCKNEFGTTDLIENISNNQVFLNKNVLKDKKLDLRNVEFLLQQELLKYEAIYKAYTGTSMGSEEFLTGIEAMIQNGYDQKRSGDVIFEFKPNFISYPTTGSTHGSSYNYDTHVPLLFYGAGIKHGETTLKTVIPDIAPTISVLLDISFPNGSTGNPLYMVFDN